MFTTGSDRNSSACHDIYPRTKTMRIALSANSSWNLWNYRAGLICELLDSGFEVTAIGPDDGYADKLMELGCQFVHIKVAASTKNPFKDLKLFAQYVWHMMHGHYALFASFTIKPNIYGAIAASVFKVPVVCNVAGLGFAFGGNKVLNRLVILMYKVAMRRAYHVFFQNKEDHEIFIEKSVVQAERSSILPGSGVDLTKFVPCKKRSDGATRFLFVGRLLAEKGVYEIVEASRRLSKLGIEAEFCLLGFVDADNPSAIAREELNRWISDGSVRYLGSTDDVRPVIAEVDCVILPSYYREGTPRSLLEAAAMGRPIITTDSVGCRDTVEHGVTGFICHPRDVDSLFEQILNFLRLSDAERHEMGRRAREKMEREFCEKVVIGQYMEKIASLAS